jgi:hypothetical protein
MRSSLLPINPPYCRPLRPTSVFNPLVNQQPGRSRVWFPASLPAGRNIIGQWRTNSLSQPTPARVLASTIWGSGVQPARLNRTLEYNTTSTCEDHLHETNASGQARVENSTITKDA